MRQKKEIYEKHFYSLDALSRAEGSIFISPPLLLFRNWKAGAVTCVYTLWSLFSPLFPRMSSLRTGADCLCLGPGKVAEAKCVQRRGSLPWDRSQDPSLWLLWGPGRAAVSTTSPGYLVSQLYCRGLVWSLHVFTLFS